MSTPPTGKEYWRSLDDLADSPQLRELLEREFPTFLDDVLTPASRRQFLKIMGASVALAGMTACRWPKEEIVPFAYRPEGVIPGVPRRYATAFERGGAALGLLVTSLDGRPIKVEGNPAHPASLGATDAFAQALVLELYDPDRSRGVESGAGSASTWDELIASLAARMPALRAAQGRGLAVLARPSSSPTLAALRQRMLQELPLARWVEWDPISRDAERAGTAMAFGRALRPVLHLEAASTLVSLDEDLLCGTHPAGVRHARDFAAGRRLRDGRIGRLWALESAHSVTGANAEHRIPLAPAEIAVAAGCLAGALARRGIALPPDLAAAFAPLDAHPVAERMETIAADLAADRGRCLVVAGPSQPAPVHALAHALNLALGAVGRTVTYVEDPAGVRPSGVDDLRALVTEMGAGTIDTLVVLGGNPVYDAPADLELRRHVLSVPFSVRLGLRRDETSRACTWHLSQQHDLESWGDARAWDGTYSVVQPLIEPLLEGRSAVELLAAMLGDTAPRGYDLVRRSFAALHGEADFEGRWRRALHDGVVAGSAWPGTAPSLVSASWAGAVVPPAEPALGERQVELLFRPSPCLDDGRFANNGWLLELPDPLTKLTWDNAAIVGPATAAALEVRHGDRVRLRVEGSEAELPVYVLPGQAAGTMTVHLGWGRTACGRVGNGVGVDVFPLRAAGSLHRAVAVVEATGERSTLAVTQDHHGIDALGARERASRVPVLVREIPLAAMLSEPADAHPGHAGEHPQMGRPFPYEGHKWGMAIDLNACVGCNACMIACQAENNIPVVGKDEVARGREMHWIRLDRYFKGDPERPAVVFQPVTCHHCENAPCEPVCPVAATLHDSEGLNVMVYNRCVGTRYCSNNCPYKVRRFNWFNNHEDEGPLRAMGYNPEVTVRGRGVMEKCTFCTQRIEAVKIAAGNARRPVADGEIVPACAQACPAQAITFGDLNDEGSAVRRLHRDRRAYAMLDELNTRPRLRYLARLRNPAQGPAEDEAAS